MTGIGNENSSQPSSLIKTEEIIILTIIFSIWIGIIILFFKQWGKIRLLEPYHPSYEAAEDCEPGSFVSAPGTTSPLVRLNSTKVMRTGGQLTTPNYSNLITKNKWKKVNTLVHVMAPNTSVTVASVSDISTATIPMVTNSVTMVTNSIPIGNNEARISPPTNFGQKIVTRKDSSVINIEMDQINPFESFVKGLENGKEKDKEDSSEGKSSRIEQKKSSIEEDNSKGEKQDEKNREERRKAWKELKGKKEETRVNMLGSEEDEEKEERRETEKEDEERKERRKNEGFITSSVSCTNLLPDPSYCFQRKRNCSSCMERVRSRTSIDTDMNVSSGKNRIECNLSKDMSETNPKKINPVEINDSKKKEFDPEGINQCQVMELKPLRVFHVQYNVNESRKKKDSEDKGEKKNG